MEPVGLTANSVVRSFLCFDFLLAAGIDVRGFSFPGYDSKFSRITIGTEGENKLVVSVLQKLVLPPQKATF